jgi:hypothetical protein
VAPGVALNVEEASLGSSSPGTTLNSESFAYSICRSSVCVSFGLITPTICLSIHDPGATQ